VKLSERLIKKGVAQGYFEVRKLFSKVETCSSEQQIRSLPNSRIEGCISEKGSERVVVHAQHISDYKKSRLSLLRSVAACPKCAQAEKHIGGQTRARATRKRC
jgi:hypothetical protein